MDLRWRKNQVKQKEPQGGSSNFGIKLIVRMPEEGDWLKLQSSRIVIPGAFTDPNLQPSNRMSKLLRIIIIPLFL